MWQAEFKHSKSVGFPKLLPLKELVVPAELAPATVIGFILLLYLKIISSNLVHLKLCVLRLKELFYK